MSEKKKKKLEKSTESKIKYAMKEYTKKEEIKKKEKRGTAPSPLFLVYISSFLS